MLCGAEPSNDVCFHHVKIDQWSRACFPVVSFKTYLDVPTGRGFAFIPASNLSPRFTIMVCAEIPDMNISISGVIIPKYHGLGIFPWLLRSMIMSSSFGSRNSSVIIINNPPIFLLIANTWSCPLQHYSSSHVISGAVFLGKMVSCSIFLSNSSNGSHAN